MSLYPTYEYPWSNTASGLQMYNVPRYNPMEEAYRYALRILENSYQREMERLYCCCLPCGSSYSDEFYRRQHDINSRYHSERDRLEYDFTRSVQQYYFNTVNQGYGYGLRQQRWEWPVPDYSTQLIPYQYTYTYLNSKEITPVPTETKKYIIVDSSDDATTYYDDGDGFPPFKSLAEAEKEAQKLTRSNPDLDFTIYQSVKKYKVAGTPLETTVFV